MSGANQVEIAGRLAHAESLRHTPAGIPIMRFSILHSSSQIEAGLERRVECMVDAVAVAREATLVAAAQIGAELKLRGFLDRKSRRSDRLELHAVSIEF